MRSGSNYLSEYSKRNINIVFLFMFLYLHVMVNPAYAKDTETVKSVNARPELSQQRKDINESEGVINEIISKQPFVNVQEETVWDFVEKNLQEDDPIDVPPDVTWLTDLIAFISMIIEAALWLAPLLAIFYLYHYRAYWLRLIKRESISEDELLLPETLFGLDVKRDSLPDDIEATARKFWENNQPREAISLLYRGAIVALFQRYRFKLPSGATEQDCIRSIENQHTVDNRNTDNIDQRIERFKAITTTWIAVAYAHRMPEDAAFYSICDRWNKLFNSNSNIDNRVSS